MRNRLSLSFYYHEGKPSFFERCCSVHDDFELVRLDLDEPCYDKEKFTAWLLECVRAGWELDGVTELPGGFSCINYALEYEGYDEEPADIDDDTGYDPYEGCLTWDC